jgi:predicted NBD/HSP70 family sugar kinase
MERKVAGSRDAGARSASRIFRAVWRTPNISRVDIADMLGLDKSTVTNQVNRLIDLGIIEETEVGEASSKGGRRPIQLAVRRSFGRVIGIEIQVASYTAVVVDLAGEILGEIKGSACVNSDNFGPTVLDIVKRASKKFDAASGTGPGPLLGVGVGVGGLVDLKKSRIRYSVPLGITRPLDFGKIVAARLETPCFVENDANCCAWGELVFTRNEDLRDFLFALVEYRQDQTSLGTFGGLGVGFGIAYGGKVYSGAHGNAGEFRSAFCDGKGDLQFSIALQDLKRMGTDKAVLQRASDELARNMAMLVNTMDFDRVYVGGDIEGLDVDFPAMLRRRLEENWMYPSPKDVEIRYSSLGHRTVAYGAAGMVLDRLIAERLIPGIGESPAPFGARAVD